MFVHARGVQGVNVFMLFGLKLSVFCFGSLAFLIYSFVFELCQICL